MEGCDQHVLKLSSCPISKATRICGSNLLQTWCKGCLFQHTVRVPAGPCMAPVQTSEKKDEKRISNSKHHPGGAVFLCKTKHIQPTNRPTNQPASQPTSDVDDSASIQPALVMTRRRSMTGALKRVATRSTASLKTLNARFATG